MFYRKGVVLCLDGNPLIKGIPALLLAYMLRSHGRTGRTVFFLGELRKADRRFGSGTNLESRLARLAKRLRERAPTLRLERKRGIRILEIDGTVEWIEQ